MDYPTYGKLLLAGYAEDVSDAGVLRTAFESGDVKQARTTTRQLVQRPVTYLYTAAEYASWLDWYEREIGRAGWFNWTDPRDGLTRLARIAGGQMRAQPTSSSLARWRVGFVLETYR